MPLYEEKLISPLAIRFTQNRIRTTFKDGRDIEATIKELVASPGVDDHDIIIEAPFPAIEIIRWSPNGRKGGGGEHWFTFDNRRLYCLQRFAVECWPKRVAAKVEVMYADSGGIRKKLDTQTQGSSVFIGHAFATADELKEWAWRKAVQLRAPPGCFTSGSEAYVADYDAKSSLFELTDVPKANDFPPAFEIAPVAMIPKASDEECEQGADDRNSSPSVQDNSLSGLIGKLLTLKEHEYSESGRCSTDTAYVSESTDIGESDDGESDISFGSLHHATPQALACPAKKSMAKGKTAKKNHSAAVPSQAWPVPAGVEAAQMQMAQYHLSQWQMAYAAQMAQWQQATYAYHAAQAFRR